MGGERVLRKEIRRLEGRWVEKRICEKEGELGIGKIEKDLKDVEGMGYYEVEDMGRIVGWEILGKCLMGERVE